MIDEAAAQELADRQTEAGYLFPSYEDASFAAIPEAVLSLLSDRFTDGLPSAALSGHRESIDHVVVFLVDGLGWDQWRRDRAESALLRRFENHGRVTPLTAIYPSETAAALTTMHTGRAPIEHGLLGWHAYLPSLDQSVNTLPFETRDGRSLADNYPEADASLLFEGTPIYNRAESAGIETHAIQPVSTVGTEYSQRALGEATRHPYTSVADLAVTMRERIEAATGPTYTYAYAPHVDTVSHRVGTAAPRYRATVEMLCSTVERELVKELTPADVANTLIVLTADHGHLNTGPETRIDLAEMDIMTEHLARGADGNPIPPQGGPRNLQFYLRDGHTEAFRTELETAVPCRTFDRSEYLDHDLFGSSTPTNAFERQAPDLVAVHRDAAMWDDPDGLQHVGVHGGLSRDEMLVPFGVARLSDLLS